MLWILEFLVFLEILSAQNSSIFRDFRVSSVEAFKETYDIMYISPSSFQNPLRKFLVFLLFLGGVFNVEDF